MTKTNLTLLTIGLVAASLLASCKKNENGGTADGQGFKASIEQSANGSGRTHGVDDGNGHINVVWNDADQILVSNNNGGTATPATLTYQLTEGKNNSNGTFYTGAPHDDFFHPNYAAIYPAQNTEGTENSLSGTTATFYLPAIQPYAGTEIFASKVVPMVAYSSNQTLSFKNACGGLRFPMVGSDVTVKRVELTTNSFNTNQHLSGKFEVDCSASDPILDWKSDGGNTITIDCGSGITLGTSETYFYFMLPPGTLHGLSLTAYDGSHNEVYKVESNREYLIERNKIKKVGANLEIPLEVTTVSPTYISYDKAWMGGTVTGGTPTECGVIYATYEALGGNPDNLELSDVVEKVVMTDNLSSSNYNNWSNTLSPDMVYFVRAYAKSAQGTYYYGESIPFASRDNYVNGKLPGAFHTADNEVCYFSMGNLQCKADWRNNNSVYWRYAENQFDFIGGPDPNGTVEGCNNNVNKGAEANNWFDLFAWGTSCQNIDPHASEIYPWSRYGEGWELDPTKHNLYEIGSAQYAYNDPHANLGASTGYADWGYNAISNGQNTTGVANKFTPTKEQMDYLLFTRNASTLNTVDNARFAFAILNVKNNKTVKGLMLFPDALTWPSQVALPKHINDNKSGEVDDLFTGWDDFSTYTEAEWTLLEQAGVVFMPCAGCMGAGGEQEWSDQEGNPAGRYWTSSCSPDMGTYNYYDYYPNAYELVICPTGALTGEDQPLFTVRQARIFSFAVRLLIRFR